MVRLTLIAFLFFSHGSVLSQTTLGSINRNVYDIALKDSLLVAISDNAIELWHINRKAKLFTVAYTNSDILSAVCFGLNTNIVLTGTRAGEIATWNLATGEKATILQAGAHGSVTTLDCNPEGRLLAAGFTNHEIKVYDLSDFTEQFSFGDYTKAVTTVKFSHTPDILASASGDGRLIVHDLAGKQSGNIGRYPNWLSSIAFSPDSNQIAISGEGGTLEILRATDEWKNPTHYYSLSRGRGWITTVDFHRKDPDSFVTGSLSGRVEIMAIVGRYTENVHAIVNTVKFLPDTNTMLTVAVATMGKGLLILAAKDMKFDRLRSKDFSGGRR